jgi:hypothetical protein
MAIDMQTSKRMVSKLPGDKSSSPDRATHPNVEDSRSIKDVDNANIDDSRATLITTQKELRPVAAEPRENAKLEMPSTTTDTETAAEMKPATEATTMTTTTEPVFDTKQNVPVPESHVRQLEKSAPIRMETRASKRKKKSKGASSSSKTKSPSRKKKKTASPSSKTGRKKTAVKSTSDNNQAHSTVESNSNMVMSFPSMSTAVDLDAPAKDKNGVPVFRKQSPFYREFIAMCRRRNWTEKLPSAKQDDELNAFMKKTGFSRAQVIRKFNEYQRSLWWDHKAALGAVVKDPSDESGTVQTIAPAASGMEAASGRDPATPTRNQDASPSSEPEENKQKTSRRKAETTVPALPEVPVKQEPTVVAQLPPLELGHIDSLDYPHHKDPGSNFNLAGSPYLPRAVLNPPMIPRRHNSDRLSPLRNNGAGMFPLQGASPNPPPTRFVRFQTAEVEQLLNSDLMLDPTYDAPPQEQQQQQQQQQEPYGWHPQGHYQLQQQYQYPQQQQQYNAGAELQDSIFNDYICGGPHHHRSYHHGNQQGGPDTYTPSFHNSSIDELQFYDARVLPQRCNSFVYRQRSSRGGSYSAGDQHPLR